MFDQLLERYADLLVSYALNVQPGQPLYINGEVLHLPLITKMTRIAYSRGCPCVHIDMTSPEHLKARIEGTLKEKDLEWVPWCVKEKYEDMVDEEAASLRLIGSEDPSILSHLDPKRVNLQQLSFRKSIQRYYKEGVGKSKVAWTVAAYATPKWAKLVYPELKETDAYNKLWEDLFKICRVDQENYLERWVKHNQALKKRAKALDEMQIKCLHFIGPETDLKVFLTPLAAFRGGGDLSSRKVMFEPNIPTEECFTTPDCRLTEGHVKVTRPFLVNGKLIQGLKLVFKEGKIVDFEAKEGEQTFRELIESDAGAPRLGEVALVGCDSPIYQSGRVFQEILLDENAACHIAVGFAYAFCLKGGENMSHDELVKNHANQSHVHTDMMISNEETDLYAETYKGEKILLIQKGNWVPALRE